MKRYRVHSTALGILILSGIILLNVSKLTAGPRQTIEKTPYDSPVLQWEIITITLNNLNRVHTKITYGFSGPIQSPIKTVFPETEWFELENFTASLNGKILGVQKNIVPQGYYLLNNHRFTALHETLFPESVLENNTLINEYDYTPPYFGPGTKSGTDLPEGRYIEYILVTGATWKNPIGKIDLYFETGVSCSRIIELEESYHGNCKNGVWSFHAENIEPEKNINLVIK